MKLEERTFGTPCIATVSKVKKSHQCWDLYISFHREVFYSNNDPASRSNLQFVREFILRKKSLYCQAKEKLLRECLLRGFFLPFCPTLRGNFSGHLIAFPSTKNFNPLSAMFLVTPSRALQCENSLGNAATDVYAFYTKF